MQVGVAQALHHVTNNGDGIRSGAKMPRRRFRRSKTISGLKNAIIIKTNLLQSSSTPSFEIVLAGQSLQDTTRQQKIR